MTTRRAWARGQSLIEYAVLVSAVILGTVWAVDFSYKAFVRNAEEIEETEILF